MDSSYIPCNMPILWDKPSHRWLYLYTVILWWTTIAMEEHCFNRNIIELDCPSIKHIYVAVLEGAPNCWTMRIDASSKLAVSRLQALLVRLLLKWALSHHSVYPDLYVQNHKHGFQSQHEFVSVILDLASHSACFAGPVVCRNHLRCGMVKFDPVESCIEMDKLPEKLMYCLSG